MTDTPSTAAAPATETPAAPAPAEPVQAVAAPAASPTAPGDGQGEPQDAPQDEPRRRRSRGGRGGGAGAAGGAGGNRGQRPGPARGQAPQQPAAARPPRAPHPVLEQLAVLYPRLFGEQPVPLKRGVFQDLQDGHPGFFDRDALKVALGLHTRSTRYLQAVATGRQRCDLQGKPVEALAPDHIYHALVELWRRRDARTPAAEKPALRDHWRSRIARAFDASGLDRAGYAERMRGRDEAAGMLLDEALSEAASQAARDEAQLRAFEAAGTTVEAFADTYGLDPRQAARTLEHARRRRNLAAATEEGPAPDADAGTAVDADANPEV